MGFEQIAIKGVSCAPELEAVAAKCLEEVGHLAKLPRKALSAGAEAPSPGINPLPQKIIDAIKDQNVARDLGDRGREFLVVKGDIQSTLRAMRADAQGGQKLLVREIPYNGAIDDAGGPDLKMWVQHYGGKEGGVGINLDMAKQADIIVNCHPELFPSLYQGETLQMLQAKHVFPWSRGDIFLSHLLDTDSKKAMHDILAVEGSWNNWNKVPLYKF